MNLKNRIDTNWYHKDYTVLEMEADIMNMLTDLMRDIALNCDTETSHKIIEKIIERGGYKVWGRD